MSLHISEIRPEILAFAMLMEQRMRDHDAEKGRSWKEMSAQNLAAYACVKATALSAATRHNSVFQLRHAIDLANYSMMTADVLGGLVMQLHDLQKTFLFDLNTHLHRQIEFSEKTFGPGECTARVLDHIRKELIEIEANPGSVMEWIDVVLLAFDGAWRAGFTPEQISLALAHKLRINEERDWPDWRTADPNKAIEHTKNAEPSIPQPQRGMRR